MQIFWFPCTFLGYGLNSPPTKTVKNQLKVSQKLNGLAQNGIHEKSTRKKNELSDSRMTLAIFGLAGRQKLRNLHI